MEKTQQQQPGNAQTGAGAQHPFQNVSNPAQGSQWGGGTSAVPLTSEYARWSATTRAIPTGGPGCTCAAAASTKPGSTTATRIPTRYGAHAAVPSATAIGISSTNAATTRPRGGRALHAALPPVLSATEHGKLSHVSNSSTHDEWDARGITTIMGAINYCTLTTS